MTIVEAAKLALEALGKASFPLEIFEEITRKQLYTFGAKDPVGVLKAELRRHCDDFTGKTKGATTYFKKNAEGKYYLS